MNGGRTDSTAQDPDAARPGVGGWWRAAHVVALSGLAVTQPVLNVLGQNPTFFVAHGSGRGAIWLVCLLAVALVPAVLLAVEGLVHLARPSWSWAVHLVVVALLGGLAAAALVDDLLGFALDDLSQVSAPLTVVLGAGLGWLLAKAYRRRPLLRSTLSALAAGPVLFVAFFAFASPANELLFPSSVAAADVIVDGPRPPIVVVVFDELPLASVLDRGGEAIDAERFPSLSRLATDGTWYADATSVAGYTHEAVPAILTGNRVRDDNLPPTPSGHPDTLFTLLANDYRISAHEHLTDLCTADICERSSGGAGAVPLDVLLDDVAVVAGQVTLPALLDDWLPPVEDTWTGFGEDPIDIDQEAEELAEERADFVETLGEQDRVGDFRQAVADVRASSEPSLTFIHAVFPHIPWTTLPDGSRYPDLGNPGLEDNGWVSDAAGDLALQRHLLQAQFADRLLGELLDRLDAEGLYDESLIVFTADHGASFRTGSHRRLPEPASLSGLMPVPLVIKAPGAGGQGRDDRPAETIDILPTVADLLGVEVPWETDGVSLLEPPRAPFVRSIYAKGETVSTDEEAIDLTPIVDRIWERFGDGDGLELYGLGPGAEHIGRPVEELRVADDPEACWVPAEPVAGTRGWVGGRLDTALDGDVPLAVSVGGRVAGTAPTFVQGEDDHRVFVLGHPEGWSDDEEPALWRVADDGLVPIPTC